MGLERKKKEEKQIVNDQKCISLADFLNLQVFPEEDSQKEEIPKDNGKENIDNSFSEKEKNV